MIVLSPITGKKSRLIGRLATDEIKNLYADALNISVQGCFDNLNEIEIRQCRQTGYKFFYPYSIAADHRLYTQLENFEWYYKEWKWEHDSVQYLFNVNHRVLEIGCGNGHFLSHLNQQGINAIGLDLNDDACQFGLKNGTTILNKTIELYSEESSEKYDFICAFQLLEHIHDVRSFLFACIKMLSPGGKIVLGVPNNEAIYFKIRKRLPPDHKKYIPHMRTTALNLPPHHMGLWDKRSFVKAASLFGLKVTTLLYEPIPDPRRNLNDELYQHSMNFRQKSIYSIQKLFKSEALNFGNCLVVILEKK